MCIDWSIVIGTKTTLARALGNQSEDKPIILQANIDAITTIAK